MHHRRHGGIQLLKGYRAAVRVSRPISQGTSVGLVHCRRHRLTETLCFVWVSSRLKRLSLWKTPEHGDTFLDFWPIGISVWNRRARVRAQSPVPASLFR